MSIAVDRYIQWLKDNGATYEKLDFKPDSDGIGSVYATTTVHEGERLATLPFRLALTEKSAREYLPGLNGHSSRNVMAYYIAQQKGLGDKSFFAPYLHVLPEKIITALLFDDNDMRYLENTSLYVTIQERRKTICEEFQRLAADVPNGNVTLDQFLWGYSVLSSRSFPYSLIDPQYDGPSEVLFPLLDALNHKPNTKITWMRDGDVETGSLSFVVGQEVPAGEQIFNNYGPKSNEELLLGYGFCFEKNEYDHVALKPNISMDPNAQAKLHIIRQANVVSSSKDPLLNYVHRNSIPPSFYKVMRVMVMNELEITSYLNCTDGRFLDFVGFRNELAMFNTINALLQTRLMALRKVSLDFINTNRYQKYALMYRQGQEQILTCVLTKIEQEKQIILGRMAAINEPAPAPPFLSINNPEYFASIAGSGSGGLVTLDSVTITLNQLFQRNPRFKKAIDQLFEDIEEEQDVVIMLALIQERSNGERSKWRGFFERTKHIGPQPNEAVEDLRGLYDSLFPDFTEAFPETFDSNVYTFEALLWAEHILNNYSLHNPLVIVPV